MLALEDSTSSIIPPFFLKLHIPAKALPIMNLYTRPGRKPRIIWAAPQLQIRRCTKYNEGMKCATFPLEPSPSVSAGSQWQLEQLEKRHCAHGGMCLWWWFLTGPYHRVPTTGPVCCAQNQNFGSRNYMYPISIYWSAPFREYDSKGWKNDKTKCSWRASARSAPFVPEMASSIFLRAPKVVIPSSFRSWSVRVRNVWRSIWKQQAISSSSKSFKSSWVSAMSPSAAGPKIFRQLKFWPCRSGALSLLYLLLLEDVCILPQAQVAEQLRQVWAFQRRVQAAAVAAS